jgi:PTS system nitrogen regulatory IIA component
MKFSEFIQAAAIRADLQSADKESIIRELVTALASAGAITPTDLEPILASILKREELGSTGIGKGVAVPHTKHASVARLVGAVGISVDGVDFNSLDGEKVHLFFLLVSPPDRPADHLRALENITKQLKDDTFCRFLKQARSDKEIKLLLDEADGHS